MRAFLYSLTLTVLAAWAFGPVGAFVVFAICAFVVAVDALPDPGDR